MTWNDSEETVMVPMPARIPHSRARRRDKFAERLKKRRAGLSPSLLAVADYIDGHRHAVLAKSALEIARETGTSDATVIRAIQALGFDGLIDLKETLFAHLGETDSPVEKMALTTDELRRDADAAIDFVIEDQRHALDALASRENRQGIRQAVDLLSQARRIGVFGIGASGIVASYAARLFSRSGYPSYALTSTGIMLAEQLLEMAGGDVVLAMMHGRLHNEGMAVIAEAERLNVPIVFIVGKADSPLMKHASASIVIPRSKSEQVALHAPLLACVETLMLALAARDPDRTLNTIDRLVEIRDRVRPSKR
jgi:DNA-binding MurR/RpiR family transcriptional regulator